jgi:hypothetical protein
VGGWVGVTRSTDGARHLVLFALSVMALCFVKATRRMLLGLFSSPHQHSILFAHRDAILDALRGLTVVAGTDHAYCVERILARVAADDMRSCAVAARGVFESVHTGASIATAM